MRNLRVSGLLLLLTALAACGESPSDPGAPTVDAPGGLDARYEWVLDGWVGSRAFGQPTVTVTWQVPTRWNLEPFRVYGRRSSDANYRLLATVTSCADGFCRYSDADVVGGRAYDYYIAVVDERTGEEFTTPNAVQVDVPAFDRPAAPAAPVPVALDDMLYLQWTDTDLGGRFWRFLVFQERRNQDSVFFEIGATDGNGFLDVLARNGTAYRYSVAVVDTLGHISDRSAISAAGIPRPDALGELVYAASDDLARSGFRFDPATGTGQIVPGDAPSAHWRFEAGTDGWFLHPLGGTTVLDAGWTTALVCGPGADADCESVGTAPESGYQAEPIELWLEHTYVLRMQSGSVTRYAKLRVGILGFGAEDRRLLIFDWAFQTAPGERNLNMQG